MAQTRKYTNITFDQVISDLKTILKAKEGALADFGESSYGRTLIELFAANTDLMAYFAESAFENSFIETATTPEAVYLGARSLGYSIRRPVPAKAGLGIQLKRTGKYPTVRVNIAKGATFSLNSMTLTAVDDMEFIYDRSDADYENGLMTLISGRAVLAEGSFITATFFSNGKKNQEFYVNDINFSDYYGFGDPNWVEPDKFSHRKNRFTTVTSDASLVETFDASNSVNDLIYWRISRRGLHDPAIKETYTSIDDFVNNKTKTNNYSVLLDTANDGKVRLQFGDGIKSAIPYGKIQITYFSTHGENGNMLNVAGNAIEANPKGVLITQMDGAESDLSIDDFNIALVTDVRGGLNIESIESIKKNASQIYNSLDSLNNRSSYKLYLSRFSDVKYANAFGEDILTRMKSKKNIDIKYSNIVRFTALKDLYRAKENTYFPTDPVEYYLDGYKVNGLMYIWQYDFQELPSKEQFQETSNNIEKIQNKLNHDISNGNIIIKVKDTNTGVYSTITDEKALIKSYFNDIEYGTSLIPDTVYSANVTPLDFVEEGSELESILLGLNRRGYITLGGGQHMYVPPIVHDFTIKIDVILFKGHSFTDIRAKIRNNIYAYLKEYTDFASPIFRSKIESIIQAFPEVAGVNIKLVPKRNKYSELDLSRLLWLGDATSQFINQSNVPYNGFDVNMTYDYRYANKSGESTSKYNNELNFFVKSQVATRTSISNYYKSYIAYFDDSVKKYVPKTGLTEEDLTKFTSYIWALVMNNLYVPIFEQYKLLKASGDVLGANSLYKVIDAIKGWEENDGYLTFKNTDSILNLLETNSNAMYNYMNYAMQYIKLVRNILSYHIASMLIDSDGNITKYTNEHEIVQFTVANEDVTINVVHDSIITGSN